MARLDKERQAELEPKRMEYAIEKLGEKNISAVQMSDRHIEFQWKGATIQYFPYSGWATGKTIKDGRGLHNLLKQLI